MPFRLIIPAAAILWIITSCGDDPAQPDRQQEAEAKYFAELQTIDASVAVAVSKEPELFDVVSPLEQVLDAVEGLSPPESLRAEHDQLISAARAYIVLVRELEAISPEPTDDAAQADRITEVLADWQRACNDMLDRGEDADLRLNVLCAYFPQNEVGQGDGSDCTHLTDTILGCMAIEIPPLPAGTLALSEYVILRTKQETPAIVGLPLYEPVTSSEGLGFYTYVGGEWRRISSVELIKGGAVVQAQLEFMPTNLIVLREE